MPHATKRLGWIPDLPDARDHRYSAPLATLVKLPPKVDLIASCPPVYDQGQLGSCTGNAIAGAIEFMQMKEKLARVFVPSRLFIYYNERVIEHSVESDAGAAIRDGIKTVRKQGVCTEHRWPYDVDKFATKPTLPCYAEAQDHRVVSYQRIARDLNQMRGCLATGYPFAFGFTVYASFDSPQVTKTGHVPMPHSNERVLGGHAVVAVGYDDAHHRFIVRNSWGPGWGMKGYFTMPYAYLLEENLADDLWTIRLTE
jgi:C1A family cysteine protease